MPNKKIRFVNYGGAYQMEIQSVEDLDLLEQLDEPFWMAVSAPVFQLSCDPQVLKYLDPDGDGRILSHNIRDARKWLNAVLKNSDGVNQQSDELQLAHINKADTNGEKIFTVAKRVLVNLGCADSAKVTLKNVRASQDLLSKGDCNGDGVITPEDIDDLDMKVFLKSIMDSVGSQESITAKQGVSLKELKHFTDVSEKYFELKEKYKGNDEEYFPFGDKTAEAFELYKFLKEPLDQYFSLCRLKAISQMLESPFSSLKCADDLLLNSNERDLFLKDAPLAAPDEVGNLNFENNLNPYYSRKMNLFHKTLDKNNHFDSNKNETLSEDEWESIKESFTIYEKLYSDDIMAKLDLISEETLFSYKEKELAQKLETLIQHDIEAGKELALIHNLEKLILLQKWFLEICNNFISFPNMYAPNKRALFEVGKLIMDQRIFNFNIKVENVEAHSKYAKKSGIYLIYCEVTSSKMDEKYYIVTPVTSRRLGDLTTGKRGVLFDSKGREWDAKIIKTIDNPVSLVEAIIAPFKKLSKLLTGAVEKVTSSTEKALEKQVTQSSSSISKGVNSGIDSTGKAPVIKSTPAPQIKPAVAQSTTSNNPRELLMTGGMTFAVLGSSFAFIAKTIGEMNLLNVISAICIALSCILFPVIIVALVKLHSRNLSSILEASGWAINTKMRLTAKLGKILAPTPVHPGSFTKVRKDMLKNIAKNVKKGLTIE